MTPWKDPELLPLAPKLEQWSWLDGNDVRPSTLAELRERIAKGTGRAMWNGKPENPDVVLVARPGSSRFAPTTECRELADAVIARDEARLRRSRSASFVMLGVFCVPLFVGKSLGGGAFPLFIVAALAQMGAVLNIEYVRGQLSSRPDRYLADQGARTRFSFWLASTRRRGFSPNLAMVMGWAILYALAFLKAGVLGDDSVLSVALIKPAVVAEPWRLITATVMHGSVLHLVFNAGSMLSIGQLVERGVNRHLVAPVWLASALAGSLASWAILPAPSVGASGGIMGVFAFLLVMGWRRRSELPPGFYQSLLLSLGMIVMMGIFAWQIIDNAAHAGGAVAGALIGAWVFRAKAGELPLPDTRGLAMTSGISLAIIGAVALFTAAKLLVPGAI